MVAITYGLARLGRYARVAIHRVAVYLSLLYGRVGLFYEDIFCNPSFFGSLFFLAMIFFPNLNDNLFNPIQPTMA